MGLNSAHENTLRNAPGPDGIQVEFLKLLDDMSMKWLTEIFDPVYNSGIIPQEWFRSEFIPIPKKQ